MLVAVTTVRRHVPAAERSGRLLLVRLADDGRATTVADVVLPETRYRAADPNPRGGTRGLRAVAVTGEGLLVASYDTVFALDRDLRVAGALRHPRVAFVHDVLVAPEGIWVASTRADALVLLGEDGTLRATWRPIAEPGLVARLGLPEASLAVARAELADWRAPGSPDGALRGLTQLNAVARAPDGGLLVSLGQVVVGRAGDAAPRERVRQGRGALAAAGATGRHAIVSVAPERALGRPGAPEPGLVLTRPAPGVPSHDIALLDGGRLACNDSGRAEVVVHDRATNAPAATVPVAGDFLRGMALAGPRRVLVGSQRPLSLHLVDVDPPGRVLRRWELGGTENESVTALAVVPAGVLRRAGG